MNETEPLHELRQAPERFSGRLVTWIIVWSIVGTIAGVEIARLLWHHDLRSLGNVARTPSYPVSETVGGIEQVPITGPARGGARVDESLKALSRYGWVDREHGVAQIPIERAMQWLADDAQRGVLRSPDPATTPDAGATARGR